MSEMPTDSSMWEEGMSFACPRCGDWLPTQAAYARFRGNMNPQHGCLCGASNTRDDATLAILQPIPDSPP
jgi:predicted RNA-binding Zn-ribbon protein involved in translation (DUF1610 family)